MPILPPDFDQLSETVEDANERTSQVIMDPKRLGEIFRALRGGMSQTDVVERSGLPQYVVSTLERGTTDKPAFEFVVRLADAYGVTPNEIAAAVELTQYSSEGWEQENLTPDLSRMLRIIRSVSTRMSNEQQDRFSNRLDAVLELQRIDMRHDEYEDVSSVLPYWMRRRAAKS